jgi:hypothetical protein
MDPILRTGLDWFMEETRSLPEFAQLHEALGELRIALDKLPSRIFSLESADEPYELADVLMVMGRQALAWQADAQRTVERKLLTPQVEDVLQKAIDCRVPLDAATKGGGSQPVFRLPLGGIRRSMESRGEPLPDRI